MGTHWAEEKRGWGGVVGAVWNFRFERPFND